MSLRTEELMAIMASFRSFDTDGDGSLNKQELENLLYHISKGQTREEVDEEVNDIMETCDKDKSGQISYAEFFSTQKKHDFGPKAGAALEKLTQFLALQEDEKKQIISSNHEHFTKLIREKEEAIVRERQQRDSEADTHKKEGAKLSSPEASPLIIAIDDSLDDSQIAEAQVSGGEDTSQSVNNSEDEGDKTVQHLTSELDAAKHRIEQLEQEKSVLAKVDEEKTRDLEVSRLINEKITQDNKSLKEVGGSVDQLKAHIKVLEAQIADLQSSLYLARQQDPNKEIDEELAQMRLARQEEQEKREAAEQQLATAKSELLVASEKYEKVTSMYTKRLSDEKVGRSNAEVQAAEEKKQKDAMRIESERLQASHTELRLKLAEFEKDLLFREENERLQQEATKRSAEIKNLQILLDDEKHKLQEEQQKTTEMSEKVADVKRAAEEEKSKLEEAYQLKEEKSQALEAEIEILKETANEKTKLAERLTAELQELRKEIKQMQIQNLKMSTELASSPLVRRDIEVEEESPVITEQKRLREDILKFKQKLKSYQRFYVVWIAIMLAIAYAWSPSSM